MFVTVNGVRLFFDVLNPQLDLAETGLNHKPILICLPGGPGGDHQTMRPFFDRFAPLAQVIYLDHRASGRSEHGWPGGWTLDQWGDDVAAFCDRLGIVKPIVLGVSGGSMVAQAYLARHPDHARAVVLVNPCARLDRQELIEGFGRIGGPDARAAAEAMYTTASAAEAPAFFRHCLPHYSRRLGMAALTGGGGRATFNLEVSQHFFELGGEAFRFDHRQAFDRTSSPVLMLAGAHDPVTRAEWGREVAGALPPGVGEFVLFENAGHLITADEPDLLTAAIERFIAAR